MASGILTLTRTGSGYLSGQIVWSSVSNGTSANTSAVTAQLQIQRSAENATTGTFTGKLTVGGATEDFSWYGTLPGYTWVTVKTVTATVGHNADGSGSCYLYALANGPTGTSMEGTSVSGAASVSPDPIIRYATILSATNFTDEGNPVITYSNPAKNAVDGLQVWLSLDGETVFASRELPKTGTSYTFELSDSERTALRASIPNRMALSLSVFVRTELDGSVYNLGKSVTMRIVNADPTVVPVVADTNTATTALTGDASVLIALHSKASVTVHASAKKSAVIVKKKVTHGSIVLEDDGTLFPVTNRPIICSATDTRGRTVTVKAPNTVIPYFNPTCAIGDEIPDAEGNYHLTVTGQCFKGSFGSKENALTIQYRYKTSYGSYGSWTSVSHISRNGNRYTASEEVTGLDYRLLHTFQVRVIDELHPAGVKSEEKNVIAIPVFEWGKDRFQFHIPVYDQTGVLLGNGTDQWQNPPMMAGTAYRTTELWNGKTVYQKLIDLGTMQSSGLKHHSTGVYTEAYPTFISLAVYATDGTFVYDVMANNFTAGTAYLWSNGNLWYVNVTCTSDMSSLTGKAMVKWVY